MKTANICTLPNYEHGIYLIKTPASCQGPLSLLSYTDLLLCPWNKVCNTQKLTFGTFWCRGFSPLSAGFKAGTLWLEWNSVESCSCSLHGGWEAEERKSTQKGSRAHTWHISTTPTHTYQYASVSYNALQLFKLTSLTITFSTNCKRHELTISLLYIVITFKPILYIKSRKFSFLFYQWTLDTIYNIHIFLCC